MLICAVDLTFIQYTDTSKRF